MLKKFFKTFILFSMILLFSSSIIKTTAYAVEENLSTSSTPSTQKNTETSKATKDTVSSNDNLNKNSSNSSSTTNTDINKDYNSNNKANTEIVTEEKKEEVIDYDWKTIDNKIYYIVNNKILETTGWFMEKDINPNITRKDKNYKAKYYLDKDFSVVIGWKQIENIWYYFDVQGIMQTGWIFNNGWYYLDSSGEMKTGWNKIGMDTYYFNKYGQATVGKKLIDSKWYFFDERGRLEKGFFDYNGKTYYSDNSGIMVTNQWINKGSHKFYIKSDSTIAIGDIFINGLMENFDERGYLKGYDSDAKNDLYVHFLDVGNADCEFIKLPSGETVLIDTGDTITTKTLIDFLNTQNLKTEFLESKNDGQTSINNEIDNDKTTNILKTIDSNTNNNVANNTSTSTKLNNGKGVIDYVILTHPHSDHIGGMIELMKNFNIGKVITPKYFELKDYSPGTTSIDQSKMDIIKYDYQIYKNTMDNISKNGLTVVQAEPDSYIDSEHILQFLHLDKDYSKLESDPYYTEYNAFNDNSAIVYLNYYDFQCLFTADIQWKAENDFFNRKALKGNTVDILKVPHHGNVGSSSYTFVGYVNPAIGIIPRAKERINTTNEPYDVLTTCGVNIYETSLTNGVSVYVTKDNWNIETK
ncbi:autolysin [Clostridium puniceum]|uniref:Autolysin n=1 Tax=Clostridium puniceum TaxID=29367 RepID=A0A1S8THI5_9CLOT|nr:MBL fold metallo-hydrolase [Clostridium puniceum]OOM77247.1 autolysin [Clostridium puniceum]